MELTILALLLSWVAIALEGWVIYLLIRRYGRALLGQDEMHQRLTAIEQTLARTTGQGADQVPQGLPIGTPAPEFALPDLDGQERNLDDFLGERPLLLAFFSLQCGFCMQMAPRLGQLPEDGPNVLLVSRGDREEHRRLAQEHGWRCGVVLEERGEVAQTYGASGTPTGYLLDPNGRVASNLAVGADAIFSLLQTVPTASNGSPNGKGTDYKASGLAVAGSRINREGLPAGTLAPDFALPDLAEQERTLAEFRGRRVLLVFSDTECGPCQALVPDLAELHRRHRGANLEVVMVSRGGVAANRAKAQEHGLSFPVLLQRRWEVSREYGIFATPVGYLIDEGGVIAKDVAVGSDAILQLV
jgi:peroxiredoxin